MKICVNLRQYFAGKIGGMENYLRNVLQGLDGEQLVIYVHESETEAVRRFAPRAQIVGFRPEAGQSAIEAAAQQGHFDVYFCPLLVLEPLVVEKPSAVMMPDLQHEFFPEFFPPEILAWRKQTYEPSARNADVVFTLSHHAKQTIVEQYGVSPEKITVIHLDADAVFRQPALAAPSPALQQLGLPQKYFYFPANYWPHKNHDNLVRALAELKRQGLSDIHLVCTGAADTGAARVKQLAAELGVTSQLHLLGYVPQSLVPEIYRNAVGLAFVTQFEGFGIPLLEAFWSGVPALTSDRGSCREVAGEAALVADPAQPADIAAKMRQLVEDAALRAQLVERGHTRKLLFSWQRAADITLQALRAIQHTQPKPRPAPISVTEWPVISVVTPTFNMAKYLPETVESILGQQYPKLDYLVLDAASKDGTVELLRKYEGRLRWKSEPDKGQADAINKGYHQTHGEIFTFLNADDTYLPNALGTIAKHFLENPKAGLIYGEAYHVAEDGQRIDRYPTRPYSPAALAEQCIICQPAAFMRRDAFAKAGMMNISLHIGLDYELWFRIAKQFPVVSVPEYLATSRMYADNKTLSSRKRAYQEIIGIVKTHTGYIGYEWLNGYACYLLDHKDQFFDRSKPGLFSYALALLLGFYHNAGQRRRYWQDWKRGTGIGNVPYLGRWEDGWISRRYQTEATVPAGAATLQIRLAHHAPFLPLVLHATLDGQSHQQNFASNGEHLWQLPVPVSDQERKISLTLETNKTWRPLGTGDYRQLGCQILALDFLPPSGPQESA